MTPLEQAENAEREVLEYYLGLEALGDQSLKDKGRGIYIAGMLEVRAILMRAKERLTFARGPEELNTDDLDLEAAGVWGRCLEKLKMLWLTEGQNHTETEE